MGELIKGLAKAFYDVRLLTSFEDMDFKNWEAKLKDASNGPVVGNSFVFSQDYVGTLEYTKYADGWDKQNSYTKAWFETTASEAEDAAKTGHTSCSASGGKIVCKNEVAAEFYFYQPGRDIRLEIDTEIWARTYYEECHLWGATCDRTGVNVHLPDDLRESERWEPQFIYIDVISNTVDGLWTWDELGNPDRDGDGLSNDDEAAWGSDPDNWDSDGDGLSDGMEVDQAENLGTDPNDPDSDDDGLTDGLEYRLKTHIDEADSDDDGLLDGEEVFHQDVMDQDNDFDTDEWLGGWLIDDIPETAQTFWNFPRPMVDDLDSDGLNDKAERDFAVSSYAYNDSPRLALDGEPWATSPADDEGVYLQPGDTITLTLTLDSTGPDPVDAVLELCLPDFLENLAGGQIAGDRQPAREDAPGCNGFQWSFTGQNVLQNWESISTEVSATAMNQASANGEALASFPYQMGGDTEQISAQVDVTLDNEDPLVSFSAPVEDEIIGGGVTDYVVGGNATDPTSWVDHLDLQLPGAGVVSAEGENPWAYTWNLPADGVYDLYVTAYDYLGHASPPDNVQVTVDNTPPLASFELQDGAFITGEGTSAISITLYLVMYILRYA
ncbi:MAG: hypothetical protein ACK2UH_09180, partial [Candidatus Promineifilaceae bacterium]